MNAAADRDDRILPFTRVVAAVVIVILVFAWIVLYLLPAETDHRFAWTIQPTMTAMVMGAGYGSAIYFFVRLLTERRWHRVTLGFFPITVFTWMMLGRRSCTGIGSTTARCRSASGSGSTSSRRSWCPPSG